VAFVRQGSRIGLVDANGVLLDMPVDAKSSEHYSFPVVTGISANEPQSTRAARMRIFERFTADLDGSGENISQELSEVDLSNPEDVKAMIPDHSTEILVHFGEDDFLDRYRRFKEHLPEWRTVYPKLSSVDMRYERQVVLEMQPGSGVAVASSASAVPAPATAGDANPVSAKPPVAADDAGKIAVKPSATHGAHGLTTKPAGHVTAQSEAAFDTPAKKSAPKAKTHATAKKKPVATKPSASTTQYHSPQAVHP